MTVVLAVRQPEAVAALLVSRDQLPLDRALLLWLSHTLEAERATRQLLGTQPITTTISAAQGGLSCKATNCNQLHQRVLDSADNRHGDNSRFHLS